MKKFLILCIISLGIVFSESKLLAALGCLDDKLHINQLGEQRFEPIHCTCSCWRYKHSLDRNRCVVCLHYRNPKKTE